MRPSLRPHRNPTEQIHRGERFGPAQDAFFQPVPRAFPAIYRDVALRLSMIISFMKSEAVVSQGSSLLRGKETP